MVGGMPEASGGSCVFLWDPHFTNRPQTGGGEQGVVAVAIAADDQRLVAARGDGGVSLWFLKTNEVDEIEGPAGKPTQRTCVEFHPDGRSLLTAGTDGRILRWSVGEKPRTSKKTGEIRPIAGSGVASVAYSSDGALLASGHSDGPVRLWLGKGGGRVAEMTGHTGSVRSVAFSPDGQYVVSAGSDKNSIRVWDVAAKSEAWSISGHTGEVTGAAFIGSHQHIASASLDGTVRLWRWTSGGSSPVEKCGRRRQNSATDAKDEAARAADGPDCRGEQADSRRVSRDFAAAIEPAAKEKLAEKIAEQGRAEENKPAERYAALDAARQLQIEAGSWRAGWTRATSSPVGSRSTPCGCEATRSRVWCERCVRLRLGASWPTWGLRLVESLLTDESLRRRLRSGEDRREPRQGFAEHQRAAPAAVARGADQDGSRSGRNIRKATDKLKNNPDDADAHLAVGKHLVFNRGDWPQGLAHLAKGSDEPLKRVAQQDLASPEDADKQADLGDAWEALAQEGQRQRAIGGAGVGRPLVPQGRGATYRDS